MEIRFKLSKAAAFCFVALLVGSAAWYWQLTPVERCWTDECREREIAEGLQAVEDEWAPRIKASTARLEEATRRVEQQRQHIQKIDDAIKSVECRKNGSAC